MSGITFTDHAMNFVIYTVNLGTHDSSVLYSCGGHWIRQHRNTAARVKFRVRFLPGSGDSIFINWSLKNFKDALCNVHCWIISKVRPQWSLSLKHILSLEGMLQPSWTKNTRQHIITHGGHLKLWNHQKRDRNVKNMASNGAVYRVPLFNTGWLRFFFAVLHKSANSARVEQIPTRVTNIF